MKRSLRVTVFVLGLFLAGSPARANGTEQFVWWFIAFPTLVVGLGTLEATIVAAVYKLSFGRAVISAWLATAASTLIGYLLYQGQPPGVRISDLVTSPILLVAFAGLILLEYPFYLWAISRDPDPMGKSFVACLMANAVSTLFILAYTISFIISAS